MHGLAGAAGAGGLLALLQGPRRGDATGVGDFGILAAILFAVALTIGPFIVYLTKRRPRLGGIAMALHAGTAIVGFVLFQAWRALG